MKNAASARECMARAMYFESNRTAEDGMLAVGTVVANRLASGRFGSSVCAVVGARSQFAPGVMSKAMTETGPAERARRVADAVLAGRRHPMAGKAMYFHTANVPFRQGDKRYVLVAGGNAFYDFNRSGEARANAQSLARAFAAANDDRAAASVIARLDAPIPSRRAAPTSKQRAFDVVAKLERPADAGAVVDMRGEAAARLALNYGAAEPELASAPVAASAPKPRRVISAVAPVMASSGPVFGQSAPPAPFETPASTRSPLANLVVAQSWSAFDSL